MSLFSRIKGAVKGFARGGITGAIAGGLGAGTSDKKAAAGAQVVVRPGVGVTPTNARVAPMSLSSTLLGTASTAIKSSLPTLTRIGGTVAKSLPVVGTALAAGEILYDAFGNPVTHRRKRRRMNPMNARAARRAIRRVKAARKMLQQIERQLPKQRVHSRTSSRSSGRTTEFIRQG